MEVSASRQTNTVLCCFHFAQRKHYCRQPSCQPSLPHRATESTPDCSHKCYLWLRKANHLFWPLRDDVTWVTRVAEVPQIVFCLALLSGDCEHGFDHAFQVVQFLFLACSARVRPSRKICLFNLCFVSLSACSTLTRKG